MKINEPIINFAVYEDSTEYLGLAEAGLPEATNKVEEITASGIAGSYESVITGHLDAMTLTLNWRTVTKAAISMNEPRNHQIELRVAQQTKDTVTGTVGVTKVKHVFIVQPKKFNPGKVAPAASADTAGEYSVSYWATFIDGEKVLEIDILNFIYFMNGKDYLEEVRSALGK